MITHKSISILKLSTVFIFIHVKIFGQTINDLVNHSCNCHEVFIRSIEEGKEMNVKKCIEEKEGLDSIVFTAKKEFYDNPKNANEGFDINFLVYKRLLSSCNAFKATQLISEIGKENFRSSFYNSKVNKESFYGNYSISLDENISVTIQLSENELKVIDISSEKDVNSIKIRALLKESAEVKWKSNFEFFLLPRNNDLIVLLGGIVRFISSNENQIKIAHYGRIFGDEQIGIIGIEKK